MGPPRESGDVELLPCANAPAPAAGFPLAPLLRRAGHPLLVSNNPERITEAPAALAIFTRLDAAGTPLAGRFRVYLYHLNGLPDPVDVAVAIENRGLAPADLFLARHTRYGPRNPSPNWQEAGADAFVTWLGSPAAYRPVASLDPRQVACPGGLRATVPPGHVAAGYFDLLATFRGGPLPAPVVVRVLALPPRARPAEALRVCAPRDQTRPTANIRGAFPSCTRVLAVAADARAGPQYLNVAAPITGRYGAPHPDEYEPGYDECDGIEVTVNGNYGVDYQVTLVVAGGPAGGFSAGPVARPAGGDAGRAALAVHTPNRYCQTVYFALSLEGRATSCRAPVPEAWRYAEFGLPAGRPLPLRLWTTVAGGSCAPARHWLLPPAGRGG